MPLGRMLNQLMQELRFSSPLPIHLAAQTNNLDALRMLIAQNQHLDLTTYGYSALHYAVAFQRCEAILLLLQAAPSLMHTGRWPILQFACQTENESIVMFFLHFDPGLIQIDDDMGYTVLYYVAQTNNVRLFRTLVSLRPDLLYAKSIGHGTAFTSACLHGQTAMVELIFDLDPNYNESNDQCTMLHRLAGWFSNQVILRRITTNHPNYLACKNYGLQTPLQLACDYKHALSFEVFAEKSTLAAIAAAHTHHNHAFDAFVKTLLAIHLQPLSEHLIDDLQKLVLEYAS